MIKPYILMICWRNTAIAFEHAEHLITGTEEISSKRPIRKYGTPLLEFDKTRTMIDEIVFTHRYENIFRRRSAENK